VFTGRPLLSARFSRDGQRLLTTSTDKTARVWDLCSGRPLFSPLMHFAWVDHAEFSPDERWILTASQDGAARIWDAPNGHATGATFLHKGKVRWAEFSPDGSRIATASDDYTAQVWDAQSGKAIGRRIEHGSWVVATDGDDPWSAWVKWFCADAATRPVWPSFQESKKWFLEGVTKFGARACCC